MSNKLKEQFGNNLIHSEKGNTILVSLGDKLMTKAYDSQKNYIHSYKNLFSMENSLSFLSYDKKYFCTHIINQKFD